MNKIYNNIYMELPSELRFENLSTPHSASLHTTKTQPVSFSQQQVRFEVPRQGILNSTAIIEWSFKSTNSLQGHNFPLGIGCLANIDRAVLSTQSGRVIMDNRNFAEKQVCEEVFRDAEYSHFLARYFNLSNSTFAYTGERESTGSNACVRFSGEPKDVVGEPSPYGRSWTTPKIINLGGTYSPSGANHGTPSAVQQVRVSIQQLFPFLYGVQLPVNIMEQLYIDIYWKQDDSEGKVVVKRGSEVYAAGGVVQQEDCFLLSDHIVYDDPAVMDKISAQQESQGGLSFSYKDYVVQTISSAAPADATIQEYERELGCSNYKLTDLRNIELKTTAGSPLDLLGRYYSDGDNIRSLQLSLNDANFNPDNNNTQMENYSSLSELYDVKPYIPRPMYCNVAGENDGAVPNGLLQLPLGGQLFNGKNQRVNVGGKFNLLGYNLQDDAGRPFQMGNTPVRLFYKKTQGGIGTSNPQKTITEGSLQYYFLGFMRSFMVAPSGRVVTSEFD
jgi:hypothetical protein